ncbi:MYB DNA-binding domain containing protein [Metarhizium album ARSEF 1941]|uniref:MYB DNA-binding domain containing protein n=1 Tax=Metarhizium album (strain ARSEF 1941) TaxID=1081103 RepID=A0A0B2WRW5_METAS|nr:MYB DNA-binding domain containing protein [Metarhizium album ARSEF 1941]KHN98796.1 MYB DNA-binding domain containing protein [Metarhizium album ARSEF 1941]
MATIEPRLIHLLNESTSTPQLHHADLPPLHALPLPTSTERPLPPLELDAAYRPSGASAYPLRLFLADHDVAEPLSHGRSKPINDLSDASDDGYSKKRARNIHVKDDFVQLPQPMKRQKSAQQAPAMPPIINGLLEPPSHPALFPPIVSNAYDEKVVSQMRLLNECALQGAVEDRARRSPEADKSGKSRKRAAKPRRKWSEEETKHLLLGVNRHGVGKWTSILEDPDFTFNDRTAGDLKDRFRTCCPEELRSSSKSSSQAGSPRAAPQDAGRRTKSGIHSENILIEDSPSPKEAGESDSTPKPRKSRAHRKKLEDLAELGIHGPFKKSHRRERRPFTEQDDREILEGLDIYGPAWTKIQRDTRFNLSSRQPTDLRDRVRNKYHSIYQRIEKGTFNSKDDARSNVLEPSVTMSIDSSLQRSKESSKVPRSSHNAKEDLPTWPLHVVDASNCTQPSQTFDFGETGGPHFMGGEMDISRLLLDDSRMTQAPARHAADYSPDPSSPPAYITEPRRDRHASHSVRC